MRPSTRGKPRGKLHLEAGHDPAQRGAWVLFDEVCHRDTQIQVAIADVSYSSLITNQVVGTGVFVQPATVLILVGSKGASLMLWLVGSLVAWAGYVRFGRGETSSHR